MTLSIYSVVYVNDEKGRYIFCIIRANDLEKATKIAERNAPPTYRIVDVNWHPLSARDISFCWWT
jgi:hypothetical protein